MTQNRNDWYHLINIQYFVHIVTQYKTNKTTKSILKIISNQTTLIRTPLLI